MEELLKVNTNSQGEAVCSARELYLALGFNSTQWKRWYEKNIICNPFATEHKDWEGFDIMSSSNNGIPTKDFAITIDFAKRLAMLARTEKGEAIRSYFIAMEQKVLNHVELPQSEDDIILIALTTLQSRVETQKVQLQLANRTIQEQAPKVKYTEDVLQSDSLLTVNAIAKELGMSAIALNHKLSELKIQYRQSGLWLLYQQYQDKGYTKPKTHTYYDSSGKMQTSMQTYWTELGRHFIHSKVTQVFNVQIVN